VNLFSIKDLADLGGWLVLAVLMAFGWLVPKRTVEREQRLLERQAEAWKEASAQRSAQLEEILSAIRRLADREAQERT
jgi:hypothetical protein